jgi:hypothetical protein
VTIPYPTRPLNNAKETDVRSLHRSESPLTGASTAAGAFWAVVPAGGSDHSLITHRLEHVLEGPVRF